MFQLLVPIVLGLFGGKLLSSSNKYETGGGIDEWRKGSSIKFRTRKEAQERVRLLKNYPNEYRNIRIDKLNYGDKFNDGYFVLFEYLKKGDKYETGGDILDMDTFGRVDNPDFADASMYMKGGKIDDSKISTGNRFGLPNGEIIKIEKRYLDSKYSGDDRIVEYTRIIDGSEIKQESTVKSLRIFLNNWGAVLIDKHLEKSIGDKYWTKFYKGGRICPVGTEIQTLIFDKDKFDKKSAKEWAKKHDFKYGFVDEKEETLRIRQQNPSSFRKDTFRTIDITKGVQAVIACPKKKYAEGGAIPDLRFTFEVYLRERSSDGMENNVIVSERSVKEDFVFPELSQMQQMDIALGKATVFFVVNVMRGEQEINSSSFTLDRREVDLKNRDSIKKKIKDIIGDLYFVKYNYDLAFESRYQPKTDRFYSSETTIDQIKKMMPEDDAYDVTVFIYKVSSEKVTQTERFVKSDMYPYLYVLLNNKKTTVKISDDEGYSEVKKFSELDNILKENKNEDISKYEQSYGSIKDIRIVKKVELYAKYILKYNDGKFEIRFLGTTND